MSRLVLALALACAAAVGCDRGRATDGTCADDSGCPAGWRCVVGAGVCVSFSTPLAPDAGPDLASPVDGSAGDAGD
jgi:hypothetical protein